MGTRDLLQGLPFHHGRRLLLPQGRRIDIKHGTEGFRDKKRKNIIAVKTTTMVNVNNEASTNTILEGNQKLESKEHFLMVNIVIRPARANELFKLELLGPGQPTCS